MEIEAPGILLSVTPFGEGDAVASIFFEAHGIYRGLARGGASRARAAIWQAGNLVEARWLARVADQLGVFAADLVHAGAALAMDDAWALSILTSICAVADGALPERQAHPAVFRGLLHLIAHGSQGKALLPEVVRWEMGLLTALGYGLDLSECAVTGCKTGLAFVSPRTGRAVCAEAAGLWKERLLPLPAFLVAGGDGDGDGDMGQWAEGLRLTGRFLARSAFGAQHRAVPAARVMLEDKAHGENGIVF